MSDPSFQTHSDKPSAHGSSAGRSNVGAHNIYEEGDQRNVKQSEVERVSRVSGKNLKAHMANYSDNQEPMAKRVSEEKEKLDAKGEADLSKKDPTLPAKLHNNEPSRGAKVDAELMEDDAEELRRKGKA